jgi:hypothetical protein
MANKLDEITAAIIVLIEKSGTQVKSIDTFDIEDARTIVNILDSAITLVEQKAKEFGGLTSKEKKQIATNVVNHFVNFKIMVPFREKIEGMVISMVIDSIVQFLNKKLGKKWLEDENDRRTE